MKGKCPEFRFRWTWVAVQGHTGHFMVTSVLHRMLLRVQGEPE